MKPLRLKEQARIDADEAATWYAARGGQPLELGFIDALQAAYDLIQEYPGIGSTRHAEYANDLPVALRFLPLKRFEHHLVYYIELSEHIEVIRVWHSARGLEALMESGQ